MAVDFLEEFLKRIREGQAVIPAPQARPEQPSSVPAAQASAAQPKAETRPNLLGRLLDTSEEARAERRATLLPMGAAMMIAGGPSRDPTNFLSVLGQGVAAGTTANDAFQKDAGARAAERARSQMQEQLLSGLGANSSNNPYSIAELKQILAFQVRTGDDAGARDTLGMIQALQKEAADNGMMIDSNGNIGSASAGLSFTKDMQAGVLGVALSNDTTNGGATSLGQGTDLVTKDARLTISNAETGAVVQYRIGSSGSWLSQTDYETAMASATDGVKTVFVRQIDKAGNISDLNSITFTRDTTPTQAAQVSGQTHICSAMPAYCISTPMTAPIAAQKAHGAQPTLRSRRLRSRPRPAL